jgi:hypothetical protein
LEKLKTEDQIESGKFGTKFELMPRNLLWIGGGGTYQSRAINHYPTTQVAQLHARRLSGEDWLGTQKAARKELNIACQTGSVFSQNVIRAENVY